MEDWPRATWRRRRDVRKRVMSCKLAVSQRVDQRDPGVAQGGDVGAMINGRRA
jgi:hypothetical protein